MKSKAIKAYLRLEQYMTPLLWGAVLLFLLFALVKMLDGALHHVALAYWTGGEWKAKYVSWRMLASEVGVVCFFFAFMIGYIFCFLRSLITYEISAGSEYREKLRGAEKKTKEALHLAERQVRKSLELEFQRARDAQNNAQASMDRFYERTAVVEGELRNAQMRAEIAEGRVSSLTAKMQKQSNSDRATERHKRRERHNGRDGEDGFNPKPSR